MWHFCVCACLFAAGTSISTIYNVIIIICKLFISFHDFVDKYFNTCDSGVFCSAPIVITVQMLDDNRVV